jgi:hypothetical protein
MLGGGSDLPGSLAQHLLPIGSLFLRQAPIHSPQYLQKNSQGLWSRYFVAGLKIHHEMYGHANT